MLSARPHFESKYGFGMDPANGSMPLAPFRSCPLSTRTRSNALGWFGLARWRYIPLQTSFFCLEEKFHLCLRVRLWALLGCVEPEMGFADSCSVRAPPNKGRRDLPPLFLGVKAESAPLPPPLAWPGLDLIRRRLQPRRNPSPAVPPR
jgi:hypothetical protein